MAGVFVWACLSRQFVSLHNVVFLLEYTMLTLPTFECARTESTAFERPPHLPRFLARASVDRTFTAQTWRRARYYSDTIAGNSNCLHCRLRLLLPLGYFQKLPDFGHTILFTLFHRRDESISRRSAVGTVTKARNAARRNTPAQKSSPSPINSVILGCLGAVLRMTGTTW